MKSLDLYRLMERLIIMKHQIEFTYAAPNWIRFIARIVFVICIVVFLAVIAGLIYLAFVNL